MKFWCKISLLVLMLSPMTIKAQLGPSFFTPNSHLAKPPHGYAGYDTYVNQNMDTLDSILSGIAVNPWGFRSNGTYHFMKANGTDMFSVDQSGRGILNFLQLNNAPIVDTDAANKAYVDAAVAAGGGGGGSGGGLPPAGITGDLQFHGSTAVPAADSGIFTYDPTGHALHVRNLFPDAASLSTTLGTTLGVGKNYFNAFNPTLPFQNVYYQDVRSPGGDFISARNLTVNIQGGYENENNIGVNFTADTINYHQQSSGQSGGVQSRVYSGDAPGDLVIDTMTAESSGCGREEDECFENHRHFMDFLSPNFGGHVVKGTVFATGDQPIQLTAFGGYNLGHAGVDMLLIDATRRVSAGNVVSAVTADSAQFVKIGLDAAHSLGTSTKTTLTHAVDGHVYTGSCPTLTDTGSLYPTAGPMPATSDPFVTLENGLGRGQINGNYVNDPTDTLIGYCLRFNAVTTAPAPGTIIHIADQQQASEFVTVLTSGTTWATAFVHRQHPTGATLAWGGGVGQGFGMAADELPAGFEPNTITPQTAAIKLVYPIAYTPDSTHVVLDTGAETTNDEAEWRTRGFASLVPVTPAVITLVRTGSVITSASASPNDYGVSAPLPGTSSELPPPPYTVAGCTTAPTLTFTRFWATGSFYNVGVASGGAGCTGTPTVTLLPTPNPAYFVPIAWIRSVVDPNACSTTPPFNCSSTDGYVLADSAAKNFTNGDEILEGINSARYMLDQVHEVGDMITALDGRNGPRHIFEHSWVQNAQSYRYDYDTEPTEYVYGSFANNWTADPSIPRSASWVPGAFQEFGGIQNTEIDDFPPTVGGNINGAFKDFTPSGELNMGSYKFTFQCLLGPLVGSRIDHPCLHGQFFPFGLAFNAIGPHPSGIFVDPASGDWATSMGFNVHGVLTAGAGIIIPHNPTSFIDSQLSIINLFGYSSFSNVSPGLSDAQMEAGGYFANTIMAGSQPYFDFSLFPSFSPVGSTTYCYVMTSTTAFATGGSGETLPSTNLCLSTGPTSLTGGANIIVHGVPQGGTNGANVYRVAGSPGGAGLICSFTAPSNQCTDTGQTPGAAPPTVDTSGQFWLSGKKLTYVQGTGPSILSFNTPALSTDGNIVTLMADGTAQDSGVNVSEIGGGGGGSDGLTNQQDGVVPLGGSATTLNKVSHIDELTSGQTTVHQKVVVDGSGPSEFGLSYHGAAPDVGDATSVVWAVDPSGNAEVSEAGAAHSRICTVANGQCGAISPPAFGTLTDSGTVSWGIASAPVASATLTLVHTTSSRTINVSGLVNNGSYILVLKQDSTGGAAATLGTGCTWFQGGTAGFTAVTSLDLTATASAINVLAFVYDGTNCYANLR